jgi:hypothetical protein
MKHLWIVLVCAMWLEWTLQSYPPASVMRVCADSLVITRGKVAIKTIGDGIFKGGFER